MIWLARLAVECYCGLPLVGDANGYYGQVISRKHLVEALHHVGVDLLRIVLHPAWLGRDLLVLTRCHVYHFQIVVDH